MQKCVENPVKLLNAEGNLTEPGYAKTIVFDYDRKDIKKSKLKIKEWDYYYIGNNDYGVALTIADNGYMGLMSVSLLDFNKKWEKTVSVMDFMPLGKYKLPNTPLIGDVCFNNKRINMNFTNDGTTRKLTCKLKNLEKGKDFECEFVLTDAPSEYMVIATPFKKNKHFYYNTKINCMTATGYVKYDGKDIQFNKEDSMGLLDWGRGVWTYKNTWYWGSLSTTLDGEKFGFNIGYGFGDTSAASENMIFYKGKSHKTNNISFDIPMKDGKEDYLANWTFTTDDGRLDMTFVPIIDRKARIDVKLICTDQHQVFGKFSGVAVLDDGTRLEFKDKLGFAEKVFMKY